MAEDIVPSLLQTINREFDAQANASKKLQNAAKLLKSSKATYRSANAFAVETGNILAEVLKRNLTAANLPDQKLYYNIANRILNETLKKNFDLVSSYSGVVQKLLNDQAGIRIKAQGVALNQDRIDGLVNSLSDETDFDRINAILDEPIVNFCQSIVDDSINANCKFQSKAGLHPQITRRLMGKGCEWCRNLAGTYDYDSLPDDIYRRHLRCRCTVEYDPGSGKRQNVWTKKWQSKQKNVSINSDKHSANSTFNLNGPVANMRRPRREDFDNYEEYVAVRAKYRANRKKREVWLDNESERFYNLRKKEIDAPSRVIKKITGYGFKTENLTSLDPVQLDAIGRTLDDINTRLPSFMEYLKRQDFAIRSMPASDRSEDMSWNGIDGVRINTEHFSDAAGMKFSIRAMIDDRTEVPGENWHPHSNEFTHNITHEFGHAFDDYSDKKIGFGKIWGYVADEFQVQQVKDLPFVSEYGLEDRGEWFAELFAQTLVGEPDDNTRRMRNVIDRTMKGE